MPEETRKTSSSRQFQARRRRRVAKKPQVVLQSSMERRSKFMTRFVLWALVVVFGLTSFAVIVGGQGGGGGSQASDQEQAAQSEAEMEMKAALDSAAKNPNDPFVWSRLGELYEQRRQFTEAANGFKKAVALDPTFTYALKHLGMLTILQGRQDEALELFNRAWKQAPNDAEIPLYISQVYAQGKSPDMAKATEYALKAMDLDPGSYRVHEWLAQLYLMQNKKKDARLVLVEAQDIARAQGDGMRLEAYQQVIDDIDGKKRAETTPLPPAGTAPVPIPAPGAPTSTAP